MTEPSSDFLTGRWSRLHKSIRERFERRRVIFREVSTAGRGFLETTVQHFAKDVHLAKDFLMDTEKQFVFADKKFDHISVECTESRSVRFLTGLRMLPTQRMLGTW
jgi:hypothetical protein